MSNEVGFSVITPAYRTERYVAETIESVLCQTRTDWELIVVDNGPSDEMAAIVESYMSDTRIRLIRQDNNGIGGARNVADDVFRDQLGQIGHEAS